MGIFGQIHPLVARNYGVDAELYCAELSLDELWSRPRDPIRSTCPCPSSPPCTRDIAVVCDKAVTVGALEDCIRRGAKGLLKDVALFDIYTRRRHSRGQEVRGLQPDSPLRRPLSDQRGGRSRT